MLGIDPEIALYMAEQKKKQDFLSIEISLKGYNPIEFAQYIESKKGKHNLFSLNLYRKWN